MYAGAEEIIVDQPREESISSLYDWIIAERAAREKKNMTKKKKNKKKREPNEKRIGNFTKM